MIFFLRRIQKRFNGNKPTYDLILACVMLICLLVVYTLLHWACEPVGLFESVFQTLQTITTVGYGNQPAETVAGRLVTIFFGFLLGLGVFANFLEKWIAYIANKRLLKEVGLMPNPKTNGYVLLNYPGDRYIMTFIRNARFTETDVPICVVDESLDSLPKLIENEGIDFVRGSLLRRETYRNAKLDSAKAIIVFPKSESPEADGLTKSVVELVTRFVDTDKTRVLYLLVDQDNAWLFESMKATPVNEDNEIHLIVQECQDPGTAATIQRLIRNTEGAIPRTVSPTKIIGWTWGQFKIRVQEVSDILDIEVDPLALIRDGEPNLLPKSSTQISGDDSISLVTMAGFDWRLFEAELSAASPSN
jgi:voltage-gated potassium channel